MRKNSNKRKLTYDEKEDLKLLIEYLILIGGLLLAVGCFVKVIAGMALT